eukprot:1160115-Pelagomonas_calceolata.AAC.2
MGERQALQVPLVTRDTTTDPACPDPFLLPALGSHVRSTPAGSTGLDVSSFPELIDTTFCC